MGRPPSQMLPAQPAARRLRTSSAQGSCGTAPEPAAIWLSAHQRPPNRGEIDCGFKPPNCTTVWLGARE